MRERRLGLSARAFEARKAGKHVARQDQTPYQQLQDRGIENVGRMMARAGRGATPTIAISHRPGHGYDTRAVSRAVPGRTRQISSPPGLPSTDRSASEQVKIRNERGAHNTRKDMTPKAFDRHIKQVHGIYIPGGQDIGELVKGARDSRLKHEARLMKAARTRGIPVLAICGGSRRLAAAYGAKELELEKGSPAEQLHNNRGTSVMAHGLSFPDPHSILGGAKSGSGRMATVDRINSTHQKIVETEREGVMINMPGVVNAPTIKGVETVRKPGKTIRFGSLPPPTVPLLQVTAIEPKARTPEGFETAFGAPHVGVTSHPEAIAGGSRAATGAATTEGKAWSAHVMKAFAQSTQTYQRKLSVNAQIKSRRARDVTDRKALAKIQRG